MQCFISTMFLKLHHQTLFQHHHLNLQHSNNDTCLFSKIKAKLIPGTRVEGVGKEECVSWKWRREEQRNRKNRQLTQYYFLKFSNQRTLFTKSLQNETNEPLLGFFANIQNMSSNGIAKKYACKRTALEILHERITPKEQRKRIKI